jgi:hypothetical protein
MGTAPARIRRTTRRRHAWREMRREETLTVLKKTASPEVFHKIVWGNATSC